MARGRGDLLTSKELKFCHNYILCGTAMDAAEKSGWSKEYALKKSYLVLRRPAVREYILSKQKEIEKRFMLTIDEIQERISRGIDLTLPKYATRKEELDISGATQLITQFCKIGGHYAADKTELKTDMNVEIKEVSDVKELTQLYEREF